MHWFSLGKVWKLAGRKSEIKVRFCDWSHQIRYFSIHGESPDGKKIIGTLDNGEKISFPKRLKGWSLYQAGDEYEPHAV
jgi:hypothetical protein